MAVATGGRMRGRLPRFQRTLRTAVRAGPDCAGGIRGRRTSTQADNAFSLPARIVDAGRAGRDDRPPLHAPCPGRPAGTSVRSRWPTASTRQQPEAYFYEQADHHRGPPELAVDRRAAAAAGLLPGDRRRCAIVVTTPERAATCAPPVVIEAAARAPGRPVHRWSATTALELGLPEMGLVGDQLLGRNRADARRHPDRDPLRPLHALSPHPSSRSWGSAPRATPRTSSPTARSRSAGACRRSTPTAVQLGGAYIHGMNGIAAEGVRQLQGTSVNQVDDGSTSS